MKKFRKQLWNIRYLWIFCLVFVIVMSLILLCVGRFTPDVPITALCVVFLIIAGAMIALLVWASGENL